MTKEQKEQILKTVSEYILVLGIALMLFGCLVSCQVAHAEVAYAVELTDDVQNTITTILGEYSDYDYIVFDRVGYDHIQVYLFKTIETTKAALCSGITVDNIAANSAIKYHVYQDGTSKNLALADGLTNLKMGTSNSDIDNVLMNSIDIYDSRSGLTIVKMAPHNTHDYTIQTVLEPTCTANGYTTYTCKCGESYTADNTTALGHNYELTDTVYKEDSEEDIDHYVYTCSRCGETEQRKPSDRTIGNVASDVVDMSKSLFDVAGDAMEFITEHPIVLIATILFVIFTGVGIVKNTTKGV